VLRSSLIGSSCLSSRAIQFFEAASNTIGINNTALGRDANVSTGNLTNATALGAEAIVNDSNKVRGGNTLVTVIEGEVGSPPAPTATRRKAGSQTAEQGPRQSAN
jgi:hypothetical protein